MPRPGFQTATTEDRLKIALERVLRKIGVLTSDYTSVEHLLTLANLYSKTTAFDYLTPSGPHDKEIPF